MRNHAIVLATVLAVLAPGASALASGRDVINDCTDDEVLTRTYTQQEYRDALEQLPADADQYGNCRDIIARAQEAAATKGSKGASKHDSGDKAATTGGPKPTDRPPDEQLAAAKPEDRAAAEEAARVAPTDAVGPGSPVAAGDVGVKPAASATSDLPTPILVLLALLLAGALAVAAVRMRSLVHARRA